MGRDQKMFRRYKKLVRIEKFSKNLQNFLKKKKINTTKKFLNYKNYDNFKVITNATTIINDNLIIDPWIYGDVYYSAWVLIQTQNILEKN